VPSLANLFAVTKLFLFSFGKVLARFPMLSDDSEFLSECVFVHECACVCMCLCVSLDITNMHLA
jgi:hypothetical protein